jgi:hypothetical protein
MSSPTGLEFEYAAGCLTIRATSRAEFGQRVAFAQLIADVIGKQPVTTLLVDLRKTAGPTTFMDRYQLGELAATYLPKVSIAVLMREEQTDKQLIGKLVARNRGVELEAFLDLAVASAWLKKYQQSAT